MGSSIVLINPRLQKEEQEILQHLAHAFPQKEEGVWVASSGSSRKSGESFKLCFLSEKALFLSAQAVNQHLQSEKASHDIWMRALPRFHVGGLAIEYRAKLAEAQLIEMNSINWNPIVFVNALKQNKVTLSSLVPTQIHDLVNERLSPPASLRAVVVGGAELAPHLHLAASHLGWPLLPSFGLTECGSQVATAPMSSLSTGSAINNNSQEARLKVLDHCQVRIGKDQLLEIKSDSLFSGYVQRVSGEDHWIPRQEPWWKTSDQAIINWLDGHSYLTPLGRGSEFVKINGEGIHLQKRREELRRVVGLLNIPKTAIDQPVLSLLEEEIVILDLPHERTGNQLVLVGSKIIPEETLKRIQLHYNETVSNSLEKAAFIISIPEIPRTELGKIKWETLREMVLAKKHSVVIF